MTLDAKLRELRLALAAATPPPTLDDAIAQAVAKASRRRAPPRWKAGFERWLLWPLALAASIFAIAFVVRQAPPGDAVPRADLHATRAFLPLVADEVIAGSADAYVLAARLPRPALAELGLPVDPARADVPVDAELLVRPDGAVLAFRFVN